MADRDRSRLWPFVAMVIIAVVAMLMFLSVVIWPAHSFDNGQYEGVDPAIRSWFKSVRSPHGVPCCDISDGHQTTWDKRAGDERYWVPIDGEWVPVPPGAVIHNAGNPVGEAIVWYVRQGPPPIPGGPPNVFIRCFVPGGGV